MSSMRASIGSAPGVMPTRAIPRLAIRVPLPYGEGLRGCSHYLKDGADSILVQRPGARRAKCGGLQRRPDDRTQKFAHEDAARGDRAGSRTGLPFPRQRPQARPAPGNGDRARRHPAPCDREPAAGRRRHHRGLRRAGARSSVAARDVVVLAEAGSGANPLLGMGYSIAAGVGARPDAAGLDRVAGRHAAGAAVDPAGGGARAGGAPGRLCAAPRSARASGRVRRRAVFGARDADRRRGRAPPGRALSGTRTRGRRPGRAARRRHPGRPRRACAASAAPTCRARSPAAAASRT